MYAIESAQPAIAETKREGLVAHYGVEPGSDATVYFDLHATLDVEHAAQERALIEPRLDGADEQALLAEAETMLRANWELLDGVERAAGSRAGARRLLIALPDPALRDEVVALRAWAEDDVPALVRACADPLTQRYTSVPSPYTPEDARLFVAGGRSDIEPAAGRRGAPRTRPRWSARSGCTRSTSTARARRSATGPRPGRGAAGVATRALGLLSGWAVDPAGLGLRRLELYAEPENDASHRVALRAGFVQGDLVRGGIALRGRRRDVVRFVLQP